MKLDLDLAVVKNLVLDVWEDLKRTRLAGVSVGMALTLVAITAIVLRPSSEPQVDGGGYAAAKAGPTREVALALPGEKPVRMADLKLAAPRDPFRTLDELGTGSGGQSASQTAQDTSSLTTAASGGAGGGGYGSYGAAPVGSYESLDTLMPLDDLAGGGSVPVAGDEDVAVGDLETGDQDAADAPTDYAYAADVQFGSDRSLDRFASVQRLGLIPSRRQPLLMYLGVRSDHRTAVFMVDSRLSQGGEGRCVPSPSLCTFLELVARPERDEHHFRDADGTEYLLRLRGIVRTTARDGSIGGDDLAALPGTPPVVDGTR